MEDNLPEIKYKKNFLSEVVVRIDFLNPINKIDKELPKKVKNKILKYFEVLEPQPINVKQIDFQNEKFDDTGDAYTEWKFFSLNRDKQLTLINSSIFISYKSFSNFSFLSKEFNDISKTIFIAFPEIQIKRQGLRYINRISFSKGDPFDWSDYINDGLLSTLNFVTETRQLTRIFHIIEYNLGSHILRFQFGIHNSDYPAPIRQKEFILDYDAFSTGIDKESMSNNLDLLHTTIQERFEDSILDGLRRVMNE